MEPILSAFALPLKKKFRYYFIEHHSSGFCQWLDYLFSGITECSADMAGVKAVLLSDSPQGHLK